MQKEIDNSDHLIEEIVSLNIDTPMRVDHYVVQVGHYESRSLFKRRCKEIKINGKQAKLSSLVKKEDALYVRVAHEIPTSFQAEDIPIDILYEDEDVLFVNKAAGMVVHPGKGNTRGTLANACLRYMQVHKWEHYEQKERLGIVHRLDAETSGVIVLAKNEAVHAWLSNEFLNRRVEKEYRALVKGKISKPEQRLETYIRRHPYHKTRFIADPSSGKLAVTGIRRLRIAEYHARFYSYLALFPKTGRTHQLRVHMHYLRCPILGDTKYARRDANFPDASLHLHAHRLKLLRYKSKAFYDIRAPLSEHFCRTLQQLEIA